MPDRDLGRMAVLAANGMSVCEVAINGETITATGTVGTDAASEQPRQHYVIAEAPDCQPVAEISLTVSNHHNAQGGMNGSVLLGKTRQIHKQYSRQRLVAAGLAGGYSLSRPPLRHALPAARRGQGKPLLRPVLPLLVRWPPVQPYGGLPDGRTGPLHAVALVYQSGPAALRHDHAPDAHVLPVPLSQALRKAAGKGVLAFRHPLHGIHPSHASQRL